jgi:hypothetical protein
MIRQGYYQDRNGVFRVPRLFRWDYVASGRKRILELAGACTSILEPQPSADVCYCFLWN